MCHLSIYQYILVLLTFIFSRSAQMVLYLYQHFFYISTCLYLNIQHADVATYLPAYLPPTYLTN